MPTDKLTDAKCRAAKPSAKAYKLFDGAGLALVVLPTGVKSWRLFYRLDGRQQTKSLGAYPEVGLAEARKQRDKARSDLRQGVSLAKPKTRAMTVRAACVEYWAGRKDLSAGYVQNALRALEMHIWPAIGSSDVGSLTRDDVLQPLLALDAKGRHRYVRKTRMWLGQVLEWCVERGQCQMNHAASIRPERAFSLVPVVHHAALELAEVGPFLRRLDLEGELQSALACKLLALTWVRTGELRRMRWEEIDGARWLVKAPRMKMARDHVVPLSRQALEILEKLRARNSAVFVFPAAHRPDRPMSENAVLYLMARMGYRGLMTGHGWRTVASTWAHEAGYKPDVIERQLAHSPDDKVRAAYNRAEYLSERSVMLQAFADWLDIQAGCAQGR